MKYILSLTNEDLNIESRIASETTNVSVELSAENLEIDAISDLREEDVEILLHQVMKGDPGAGVPAGGASNQFLKKRSSTDYDFGWGTIDSAPTTDSVNPVASGGVKAYVDGYHDASKYDASNPEGYTSNVGTITGIKMNGETKGVAGEVDLGIVITEHQDISGKEDKSNKTTSLSASSTDTQYPSAKCIYDLVGNVESLLEALL